MVLALASTCLVYKMEFEELITDEKTFLTLREQCSRVFHIDRRLPEQVFRQGFSRYFAFEHALIMRNEFAEFLATLAQKSGDKKLNYMTIEPDPVDYYRKHSGFYGLASFSARTIVENYTKVMHRGDNADSFRARGGDVAVLWGDSLKWGIFCDRKSWEVCLLGADVLLEESAKNALGFIDGSNLELYISNLYDNKENIAREFVFELDRNYSSLF